MNIETCEIKAIFKARFQVDIIEIIPCGNHELNRNQVYRISDGQEVWIIKFYYKEHKRIREINALNFYSEAKHTIKDFGITDSGYEWIIYSYLSGVVLDCIFDELNEYDEAMIVYEIGCEMAKLHNSYEFDYFGDWMKQKQSSLDQYQSFIISDTERIIDNIIVKNLPEKSIILEAIHLLRNEYCHIRALNVGRLCHRDLDGRNIIVVPAVIENSIDLTKQCNKKHYCGSYHLSSFLDFEKCVVFNEYFDIVGLYRKYFLKKPYLIEPFFDGYETIMKISDSFNNELKFNLLRTGVDLASWAMDVSEQFYFEVIEYLKMLLSEIDNMEKFYFCDHEIDIICE